MLRFYFSDGLWITPLHEENKLKKTVRTDAAIMELKNVREEAITLLIAAPTLFNQRRTKTWQLGDLVAFINRDKGSLEFISRKITDSQQIWECELHSTQKPFLRNCELRLPKTEAVFGWNDMLAHREW